MSTDKNYEKLYKDALERAKKIDIDEAYASQGTIAKTIFPELAESDNERIKKSILHKMEACKKQSNFFSEEEISWLEKQKDLDKMIVVSPEVWDNAIADAYENGKKDGEKQEEQKPELPLMGGDTDTYFDDLRITTKSLTSREWFNEGIKFAQRLQKEPKPVDDKAFEEWIDDWYQGSEVGGYIIMSEAEFKNWSRGIRNMYQQKPAEWSEEDEKQIAQIERICKNAGCSKMLQEKIHNWFDSLCFKMVKWDTNMMNIRNSIREVLYKEKRCPNAWFTYLEHCGPQTKYAYWKPTEDQMEAIKHAYNSFPNDCPTKSNLMFLYRDLKKLM